MEESTEKSTEGIEKRKKNLRPPFPKGTSGNPAGRVKGRRNFMTIYIAALEKLAKAKKITPEELEDDILKMAVLKARNGDYRYFKDLNDRQHGQAKAVMDISGDMALKTIIINKNTGKK